MTQKVQSKKEGLSTFSIPLYRTDIALAMGKEEIEKLPEYYLTYYEEDNFNYPINVDACVFEAIDKKSKHYTLVLATKNTSITAADLVHEIAHLALCTCRYTRVLIDTDNQEPLCYLMGYITEKVMEKWKDKIVKK